MKPDREVSQLLTRVAHLESRVAQLEDRLRRALDALPTPAPGAARANTNQNA